MAQALWQFILLVPDTVARIGLPQQHTRPLQHNYRHRIQSGKRRKSSRLGLSRWRFERRQKKRQG
jgi:hypothetical protein